MRINAKNPSPSYADAMILGRTILFVAAVHAVTALSLAIASTSTNAQSQDGDLLGDIGFYVTRSADTLPDIAVANDLGYVELIAANRNVDPWLPGEGTRIVLPHAHLLPDAPRRGIVINVAEQRLYYYPPRGAVQSFPIGIATDNEAVKTGVTHISAKRIRPTWIPTASVRAEDPTLPAAVPPGPNNPLGDYALNTDWDAIVIHGTNRPYGVGRRVSHGCFRLYPADIDKLFHEVEIGTQVAVVDQPAKAGWSDGVLYLEMHPTIDQAEQLESGAEVSVVEAAGLERLILDGANAEPDEVDWGLVDKAAHERSGIPTRISK